MNANFAEIPWQAMILRDSNRSLLCGGIIIRRDAVLTTAHCVDGLVFTKKKCKRTKRNFFEIPVWTHVIF